MPWTATRRSHLEAFSPKDRARRRFLGGLAAIATAATFPLRTDAASTSPVFLAGRRDQRGGFRVTAFDGTGAQCLDLPLPARGHDVVLAPDGGTLVMVARRPGRYLLIADLVSGRILHRVDAKDGRHFCGHGVFSADGARFFASENDFDHRRGVIGIYAVDNDFRRLGEWPSYGVGPHDLALAADSKTLVVANGGIATHPDTGRQKLNLKTMAPSLTYLDTTDGRLAGTVRLPPELHQLSIRHLAVAAAGPIAVGMQYQGPRNDDAPLVAVADGQRALTPLPPPAGGWAVMRQYCGSVAFDSSGRFIAATSPRGAAAVIWDFATGSTPRVLHLPDTCGLAPGGTHGTFMLTSGTGRAALYDAPKDTLQPLSGPLFSTSNWDNHLTIAI